MDKKVEFLKKWEPYAFEFKAEFKQELNELLEQYAQQVSREVAIEFLKSQDVEYMRKFSDRTFNYMFNEWYPNQQNQQQ